jgi:hypothetical protein
MHAAPREPTNDFRASEAGNPAPLAGSAVTAQNLPKFRKKIKYLLLNMRNAEPPS